VLGTHRQVCRGGETKKETLGTALHGRDWQEGFSRSRKREKLLNKGTGPGSGFNEEKGLGPGKESGQDSRVLQRETLMGASRASSGIKPERKKARK